MRFRPYPCQKRLDVGSDDVRRQTTDSNPVRNRGSGLTLLLIQTARIENVTGGDSTFTRACYTATKYPATGQTLARIVEGIEDFAARL